MAFGGQFGSHRFAIFAPPVEGALRPSGTAFLGPSGGAFEVSMFGVKGPGGGVKVLDWPPILGMFSGARLVLIAHPLLFNSLDC